MPEVLALLSAVLVAAVLLAAAAWSLVMTATALAGGVVGLLAALGRGPAAGREG